MKIGIFGGAFNPPHIGHVQAAKSAAVEQELDLLIVIPTGTPPHKTMPSETPVPRLRLEMSVNAFGSILPSVTVSDIEVFSEESNCNYTIDTIKTIEKEYPGAKLYLLVGNDMYDSLDTWKDSEALLKMVMPVLLPREVIEISSTQVRELLKRREGVEYVSEANYALIIKHRLYGAKPNWDWLRKSAHAMLDPSRIPHADGCELAAMQLAEHWGENADDAREAAILHDITKKLDFSGNLCIIAGSGLVTSNYNKSEEKLLHSVTAALLAKSAYGVSDRVAKAIKLHTTGAADMSLLDKIIYVADYIEPTRDFPGIDELRQAAFENIDKAMHMGLQMVVSDLNERGIPVNRSTIDALNSLTGF